MEFAKLALIVSKGKRFVPVVPGAVGGYAYDYFIGCASGSCPISSNPWISTAYGMVPGGVLTMGLQSKPADSKKDGANT